MKIITLTTDFGDTDWFVGAMKGVILNIQPRVVIVDITHGIPAGDIRAGAFALAASWQYFPRKSIHLAVVDPGVGSPRPAIAVQTRDSIFVGPDNGLLSWALRNEPVQGIRRLENEELFLHPVSRTFHGRDVFAPVAARLSKGMSFNNLGPEQKEFVQLPWPKPRRTGNQAEGEVLYIDRFGNAITNLDEALLDGLDQAACRIFLRGKSVAPLQHFYQEVPTGRAIGLVSSSGFLEIAINEGSAAKALKLKIGDPISVHA